MNTTAKTLSALLLGAALITPAFAQDSKTSASNSAAQSNDSSTEAPAAAPTTPVDAANNITTASNSNTNTQIAMNTTGNGEDLSSIPDTHKKYSRANRSRDFRKEARTTKELNEKAAQLAQ